MVVEIHDTKADRTYYAFRHADCKGVDKHAYAMLATTGERVVTMGAVVASRTDAAQATIRRDEYRGMDDHATAGAYIVQLGPESVLCGMPKAWASKAARLLNKQPTAALQKTELLRIRAACDAADQATR